MGEYADYMINGDDCQECGGNGKLLCDATDAEAEKSGFKKRKSHDKK